MQDKTSRRKEKTMNKKWYKTEYTISGIKNIDGKKRNGYVVQYATDKNAAKEMTAAYLQKNNGINGIITDVYEIDTKGNKVEENSEDSEDIP